VFHLIFPGWIFVHIERENNIYFFEKTTEKPFPNQKIERNGRTLFSSKMRRVIIRKEGNRCWKFLVLFFITYFR
jgi:hypothetical protein